MKIKNKTRFRVLCALYVIGYLFFCILGGMNSGMMISDSPALAFAAIYYGLPVGVRNLSVSMFVWIILSVLPCPCYSLADQLVKTKAEPNSAAVLGWQYAAHLPVERYRRVAGQRCCRRTVHNAGHLSLASGHGRQRYRDGLSCAEEEQGPWIPTRRSLIS